MADKSRSEMLHEEVAFNLVIINAILEFLENKYPGAKQEVYEICQHIIQEHDRKTGATE